MCLASIPCYPEGMCRLSLPACRTDELQRAHRRKSRQTNFPYTISRSLQLTNRDSDCHKPLRLYNHLHRSNMLPCALCMYHTRGSTLDAMLLHSSYSASKSATPCYIRMYCGSSIDTITSSLFSIPIPLPLSLAFPSLSRFISFILSLLLPPPSIC